MRRAVRARAVRALAAALALSLPAAAPAPAQAIPAACTYDACALRVEQGWFSRRLVRGTAGSTVTTLSGFGSDLAAVFQGSDSALHHARAYRASQRRATVLTLAGTVVTAAGVYYGFYRDDSDDDDETAGLVIAVGGSVLTGIGSYFETRAVTALSRAVWWYNRELPR